MQRKWSRGRLGSSSSSLAPEEAYADAYRRRLREYGTIGEDSALEGYLGRPLRGMTTGALAVGTEAEGACSCRRGAAGAAGSSGGASCPPREGARASAPWTRGP
jgi:hypothetical protein